MTSMQKNLNLKISGRHGNRFFLAIAESESQYDTHCTVVRYNILYCGCVCKYYILFIANVRWAF